MEHVFVSPAEVYSPRWKEAFASARIIDPRDENLSMAPSTLAWVLLDGDDADDLLEKFLRRNIKVLALTRNENPVQAKRLIAAGASGYLHYLATPSLLQQVAQVIELGGIWLGAELMRQLMLLTAGREQISFPADKMELLTPREKAVAEAVAVGKTNKEVARMLDITERTVKAHMGAIFEKLGVRDRLQLVLYLR